MSYSINVISDVGVQFFYFHRLHTGYQRITLLRFFFSKNKSDLASITEDKNLRKQLFYLIQDTVVAMQALALYSERTDGRNDIDLRVKLASEKDPDWKPPEIHITPENALLRRQIDVRAIYVRLLKFIDKNALSVSVLHGMK